MTDHIRCPICQTVSPISVERCPNCGAHLNQVRIQGGTGRPVSVPPDPGQPHYDAALGEDDLYAPSILRFPWWGIVVPVAVGGLVLALVSLLLGVGLSQWLSPDMQQGSGAMEVSTAVSTMPGSDGLLTAPPTLFLPTLTPTDTPTATPTSTPTPGPCEQVVGPGDTLITLATRCGHRDLAIIDEIIQLNGLRSAESLQQGQRLLIPWPTATPGPESDGGTVGGGVNDSGETSQSAESDAGEPTPISAVIPTATLQPGVMWYTVQPDDNIIRVASLFSANVKVLSELNPEVTFSQCDFGMDYGGANCIVQLYQGQQLRVPVPTATPTLSPTPSGSETPTPTPTPTFNAPALLSPGDRFLFGRDDIVTLRWTSTGSLGQGEAYRLTVIDTTSSAVYTAITSETMYIAPDSWQPMDGTRHLFTWEVAVGPIDAQGNLQQVDFQTPSRLFFWDSR